MPILFSVFMYGLVTFAFTYFDVQGFGVLVQSLNDSPAATKAYRIMQIGFQFTLYGLLLSLHLYGALAGFVIAHWCFGCDGWYYQIRGENYEEYNITWFAISFPSLVCKLIGVPFTGKILKWVWPTALIAGFVISILFA